MKKNRNKNIILTIVFAVGLILLCYPVISNLWNNHLDRKLEIQQVELDKKMPDEEKEAEWEKALAYNRAHPKNHIKQKTLIYDEENDVLDEEYEAVLNPYGNGVMGRIAIPRLELNLPIFHGCGSDALSVGVGHVEGTSLPVGGIGSHSAVTAHRGSATRKLFTDLDKMEVDDIFSLHVLDHDLYYRVDQIQIVLPGDVKHLDIDPNKDYCTLVTCTPFAVNTHRLLVRGVRCEKPLEQEVVVQNEKKKINLSMQAKLLIGGLLFFILVMIIQSAVFKVSDSKSCKKEN